MDLAILGRVLPALVAATVVAWVAGRPWEVRPGRAFDEVLRAGFVGVVVARLAWLVLAGPDVWRTMGATVLLLRAGVETWVGVAGASAWVRWRERDDAAGWAYLRTAAPASGLAGVAAWHLSCAVEGVCAGVPVSWGVALPGYISRVVPVGYLEGFLAALLAVGAWHWRHVPARSVGAVAAYAAARAALGLWKAPLVALPTRDQLLSAAAAVVLAAVAARARGTRTDAAAATEAPDARDGPAASAEPGLPRP